MTADRRASVRPATARSWISTKDKVRNVKFRRDSNGNCVNIAIAFDECEVHHRSEQRAEETRRKLMASGEKPEKATGSAGKYAALQLKQTKGKQFRILWKKKTIENMKKGMHPVSNWYDSWFGGGRDDTADALEAAGAVERDGKKKRKRSRRQASKTSSWF
ncbi:hypothetical protein FOZ60_012976 [Perkinsus olseni]|uniref:Uncharacterized protein n=1 Tax=Perkinsus olseni TaxID=32597 RepID=A0A7J6NA77_PEROL|nr:hypothetical protein FOZ60_012976 [Perkinsus olseni]